MSVRRGRTKRASSIEDSQVIINDHFNQKSLNPETSTSAQFLDDIKFTIDLQGLYKMKGTTYNSSKLDHYGILLEIINPEIKDKYDGANYLLQVWSYWGKQKSFERTLKNELKLWASSGGYFMFLPNEGDEGCEYLHIFHEDTPKNITRIKNFGQEQDTKYICYNGPQNLMMCGSEKTIHLIRLHEDAVKDRALEIYDANVMSYQEITPGSTLQNISFEPKEQGTLMAFETYDNQLEFNYFTCDNVENSQYFTYSFTQYTEIMPRKDVSMDNIVKTCVSFYGNFSYAIALRKSGLYDIYWDGQRKDSSTKYVNDVASTTNAFYLSSIQDDINICQVIQHDGESSVTCDMAKKIDYDFDKVCLKDTQTFVFLGGDIFDLIQLVIDGERKLGVVLNNGDVFINKAQWFAEMEEIAEYHRIHTIDGAIQLSFQDSINYKYFLTISKKPSGEKDEKDEDIYKYKSTFYYNGILQDITHFGEIDQNVFIVQIQTDAPEKYILVQNVDDYNLTESISIYQIILQPEHQQNLNKRNPSEDYNDKESLMRADEKSSYMKIGTGKIKKITAGNDTPSDHDADDQEEKEEIERDQVSFKKILSFEKKEEMQKITEALNSVICDEKMENAVMADDYNMYILNLKKGEVEVFEGERCLSLSKIEGNYIYSLSDESTINGYNEGMRLYNLEDIIKKKRAVNIQLGKFDVGASAQITRNSMLERLFYIKSLTHLEVIPLLHQSCIKFIGMDDQTQYLATKTIKDKFIALHRKGWLQTWSLVTGKFLNFYALPANDWNEKFAIATKVIVDGKIGQNNQGILEKAVLKSIKKYPDLNYKDFFEEWQIQTNMKNQKSYLKNVVVREWKVIEIMSPTEVKEHLTFFFPEQKGAKNEIYFNDKLDQMIKVTSFGRTYLYKVQKGGGNQGKDKLVLIKRLTNYPTELEVDDEVLQCFSPDFSQTLYSNKKKGQFFIRDTLTNNDIAEIPPAICQFKTSKEAQAIIKRFRWMSNNTIKIVNLEGNEKIFDYMDQCKELFSNRVPVFDTFKDDWKEGCFYFNKKRLAANDTLKQLKRQYQTYKSCFFLENLVDEADFYKKLMYVDPRNINFVVHSFTYLDWEIIEQLGQEKINIPDLSKEEIEKMLFNILPGGQTILHKLTINEQTDDLLTIFQIAHPNPENISETRFHVPFLPDFKNITAMHIAESKKDLKTISLFLKYLSGYDIGHHSRSIRDLYSVFIENEIKDFLPYLESRMVETRQTKQIHKGMLKEGHNGILASPIWFRKTVLLNEVMDQETKVEERLKCEIIDLPFVYHFKDDNFHEFFGALAETEWFDIFQKKPIQHMINFNYPLVREHTIKKLFIPYIFFLCLYMLYFNIINVQYRTIKYETTDDDEQYIVWIWYVINLIGIGFLFLFSLYFFKNEVKQLIKDPIDYFLSFWNYIDFIPTIGIAILTVMQIYPHSGHEIQTVFRSITTFVMWVKVMYFLRIFKGTGFYIGMIIQVIHDIRWFLLVLIMAMFTFGDTFLTIAIGNDDDDMFTTGFVDAFIYSWRMGLGDWDTDDFGTVATYMMWVFFFLCTFFIMIILLNLLIAIVGDAFNTVNSNAENASYKEMASLISENSYLIPKDIRQSYAEKNKYLIVVSSLDNTDHEPNHVQIQFDAMKAKFDDLKKQNDKQDDVIAKIHKNVKKLKEKILPDQSDDEDKQLEEQAFSDEDAEY